MFERRISVIELDVCEIVDHIGFPQATVIVRATCADNTVRQWRQPVALTRGGEIYSTTQAVTVFCNISVTLHSELSLSI